MPKRKRVSYRDKNGKVSFTKKEKPCYFELGTSPGGNLFVSCLTHRGANSKKQIFGIIETQTEYIFGIIETQIEDELPCTCLAKLQKKFNKLFGQEKKT